MASSADAQGYPTSPTSGRVIQSPMSPASRVRKVVFVRHGESQGNAKNVYTGWGPTKLSVRGEQEAVEAGLCIKASGMKFDTCYTSLLPRAVKTAELLCNTAGLLETPVVKNWRLNARHSGALQGLTPDEAVATFGEAKVSLWRSSYDVLPACVEESDPRHPVNDALYADVPREELPAGGESLKHVVDRVVPYWSDQIVPKVQAGKNVLIVAHKNSFRALWKYIEQLPDEQALDSKLAPASAPLIYEFEDVGESGLVFKQKYIMNFPTVNPELVGAKELGKAYFLRHAESVNNARGSDNGWEDTGLTLKGEEQAVEAGICLRDKGVKIDMIFTSVLQRAVKTAEFACMTSNNAFDRPVIKSWRLNARHSGALHGLTNAEAVEKFGEAARVFRTQQVAPPAVLESSDPRHPANDPLYADVPPEDLPGGESFDMMAKRVLPFWEESILPHIGAGKSVLIVAHRNPLKAILEHCNNASEKGAFDEIVRSTLPFVQEFGLNSSSGKPAVLTKYSLSSFAPQLAPTLKAVGKAVFLRHGESLCNLNEAFTGWEDSGLTPKGEKQAVEAGEYLSMEGWKFDIIFTSVLSRALESVDRICKTSGNSSVPIVKSWRMNARHPGVLQGLTKPEAIKEYGKEKVNLWRGSYDVMPECVSVDDPRHPANDPLYAGVSSDMLPPGGESLKRVVDRIVHFWQGHVVPRLRAGETVLVVGHKNSLKALFMYLEDTSEHDMFDVRPVSTTAPLVFEFGDSGFSSASRLVIVKKYWIKHTEKEALEKSKCKDGSLHM
mmetsp:Transcript_107255/g.201893  ORF Transcript_107255/g.201893 Transcript_107255/m.201893 type:complete len:781 (-) Transcript_107255:53-2395(-)